MSDTPTKLLTRYDFARMGHVDLIDPLVVASLLPILSPAKQGALVAKLPVKVFARVRVIMRAAGVFTADLAAHFTAREEAAAAQLLADLGRRDALRNQLELPHEPL